MATPDFRLLFESAPGMFLVLRPDLVIVAVSDAYTRATMTLRDEIVGRGLFDVFPDNPGDPSATGESNLRASLERVCTLRVADTMAVQKYDVRQADGTFVERHWSPVNTPVFDATGAFVYIIHRVDDVTDFVNQRRRHEEVAAELRHSRADEMEAEVYRRAQQIQDTNRDLRIAQRALESRVEQSAAALLQREEQLRQAQKMEAIGKLAGGIAHDFNNVLSVILSYTELMLQELDPGDAFREDVEEISKAALRASALTRQLLMFSRQQVLEPRVIDLNVLLGETEKMLRRVLGEDVELVTTLQPSLGHVRVDPGSIEQVIMNLVVNARDAMPTGGQLTIETANTTLDASCAAEHFGVEPGPYVLLAVTDTGVGMDRATQRRIFEPFFTTKDQGKGTGLGLSTVFGIVQQSGGSVWVYSEPDHGTCFKIYLPVVDEALDASRLRGDTAMLRGTETVLLVEDEPQVRTVVRDILERHGYRVIEANSAAEAVAICQTGGTAIDLLLTDVVMPQTSGAQLARELAAVLPSLKLLFMSGYTDDSIVRHGVLSGQVAFLQKPITPDALLRRVREIIDGPQGG